MLHAPSYACVWTLGERLARAPHAPVVFNLNPVAGKAPVVSFFLRPWPTFCSDHDWTLGCSKWWLKMPRSSGLNLGSGKPSRFRPSSNTIQTNYKTSQIFQKWFSLTQEQKPLIFLPQSFSNTQILEFNFWSFRSPLNLYLYSISNHVEPFLVKSKPLMPSYNHRSPQIIVISFKHPYLIFQWPSAIPHLTDVKSQSFLAHTLPKLTPHALEPMMDLDVTLLVGSRRMADGSSGGWQWPWLFLEKKLHLDLYKLSNFSWAFPYTLLSFQKFHNKPLNFLFHILSPQVSFYHFQPSFKNYT